MATSITSECKIDAQMRYVFFSVSELFEMLMSQDRSRMGIGVSCTKDDDPNFTHIILYME